MSRSAGGSRLSVGMRTRSTSRRMGPATADAGSPCRVRTVGRSWSVRGRGVGSVVACVGPNALIEGMRISDRSAGWVADLEATGPGHRPEADSWDEMWDFRSPRPSTEVAIPCGRWCPREDSNLRARFRKPMLYPLSYEGGDDNLAPGSTSGRVTSRTWEMAGEVACRAEAADVQADLGRRSGGEGHDRTARFNSRVRGDPDWQGDRSWLSTSSPTSPPCWIDRPSSCPSVRR